MAICKTCGKKYSRWTAPVSAKEVCGDCFESDLPAIDQVEQEELLPASEDMPSSEAVPAKRRDVRIRLSSFIPRSRSKAVFVIAMSCYSLTLSRLIGAWASALQITRPLTESYPSRDIGTVLELLVFAPLLESLVLIAVLELVRRARAPEVVQALTAAFFVSELHVWPWWPHAFIVLPSFCIQAASYLYWRRSSFNTAFWVLVAIHACHNFIPAVGVVGRSLQHP
jgi:hypothetical protein